ncbi:MAG: sigma-70 family RNA polymerase sigma factor [Deltaproteobacteria bacterium]
MLPNAALRPGREPPVADATLVARIRDGDRWAKEMLFRRHVESVGTLAMRVLQHRADAEDAVHDTFVAAFRDIHQLRDPDAVGAWLRRIAVNRIHRRFRKRKLLRRLGLDRSVPTETLEACCTPDASPELRAELALIDRRLERLDGPERLAWTLRHVEGATLPEVADALNVSLSTAKRRLRAAEDALGLEAKP